MSLCTKKAEDEKFMMIYKRKNKQISQRVPNVDDQTPLPEENSEALLEKPTDNEDPVVQTYVSKSQNKHVGVVRCVNCGGDLHQTAKSLQMEQDQWLFRNNGCVAEAENVNKQTAAENDTEVEGNHQELGKLKIIQQIGRMTMEEEMEQMLLSCRGADQTKPGKVNIKISCPSEINAVAASLLLFFSIHGAKSIFDFAPCPCDGKNQQLRHLNFHLHYYFPLFMIFDFAPYPLASARFSSCMLENCITADEPDTRLYTDQNSNFQGTLGGLYDTDECFPDTMLEYVGEIMDNYLKLESKIPMYIQPSYLTTVQNDLISAEMRQDVVDWLIMIHQFYDLMQETLYLSINAMDIYLTHEPIQGHNLMLVALCALFMAGKYEEMYFPPTDPVESLNGEIYTADQIISMEETMANFLQHTFGLPTQFKFLNLFLKMANADTLIRHMAYFLSQLSLTQYEMLKYPPSKLAAAAIYYSQCAIYKHPKWDEVLQSYTGYKEDQLKECARLMAKYHHRNSRSTLSGLYGKFSGTRFSCVACRSPATIPE